MGADVEFAVTARSTAGRAAVYELVRAGATWPAWSPIGSFTLARPAPDGSEGVGAVRVFRTGLVRSREELIEIVPGRSLSYRAVAGLPLRGHRADVELEDDEGGGTRIVWRERFRTAWPGTAAPLRWFLRAFVQRCADGLARHAAAGDVIAPSGPSVVSSGRAGRAG
jgi:hypothetical protein